MSTPSPPLILAERYHDISCGHRVCGHESKCAHLHGHNYRIHFKVAAPELDHLGRVLDFSVIKSKLCDYLENYWDHKTLLWDQDPLLHELTKLDPYGICSVPFNPTAENIGLYLLNEAGPELLEDTDCLLVGVRVEETRKCSAYVTLGKDSNEARDATETREAAEAE